MQSEENISKKNVTLVLHVQAGDVDGTHVQAGKEIAANSMSVEKSGVANCADDETGQDIDRAGFLLQRDVTYTSEHLRTCFQLLGLKPRHADRASKRLFDVLRDLILEQHHILEIDQKDEEQELKGECISTNSDPKCRIKNAATRLITEGHITGALEGRKVLSSTCRKADAKGSTKHHIGANGHENASGVITFASPTLNVQVSRFGFISIVLLSIQEYKYYRGSPRKSNENNNVMMNDCGVCNINLNVPNSATIANVTDDLKIATDVIERKSSYAVLLCGTSGTGKSTLASLLAGRLGISTVISTDSIRQMLRSTIPGTPKAQGDQTCLSPTSILCASTYNAGDVLNRDAKSLDYDEESDLNVESGWRMQSNLLSESISKLLRLSLQRRESVIVEGVHITMELVAELMKQESRPVIIPFLVYISNEQKHRERFAVRAKYMTLDPGNNRYIKYFRNIRYVILLLLTFFNEFSYFHSRLRQSRMPENMSMSTF